jgi:hypothetical protein
MSIHGILQSIMGLAEAASGTLDGPNRFRKERRKPLITGTSVNLNSFENGRFLGYFWHLSAI